MGRGHTAAIITVFLLAIIASTPAAAYEVYHWVDENGVSNFSQWAPADQVAGVSKLTLADTTPPDHDPEEDLYDVKGQAERMKSLWEEIEKQREARRGHQQNAPQQQLVYYRERPRYAVSSFWWHPPHHRPPPRPRPPIERPLPSLPFSPPGRTPN